MGELKDVIVLLDLKMPDDQIKTVSLSVFKKFSDDDVLCNNMFDLLIALKNDGYNSIYITKKSLTIVAFVKSGGFLELNPDLINMMSDIKPLTVEKEQCTTIDEVLDKINKTGINSLSIEDLKILNS